jgi:hypothetical protein
VITLAEAGAICAAASAATTGALILIHWGERIDDWAIWTATTAAAIAAGALIATLAAEIGAALAR